MNAALPDVPFLLVDDREENLIALEALLRRPGLLVLKARSGTEALEVLLAHDVALALVDVQMPDMDGFDLAELMRGAERTRHVPIIFVTASGSEAQRTFQGYEAGAVDFLHKPIDPIVLRHKTNTFFELHRQKQLVAAQLAERVALAHELEQTLRLNELFIAAVGHDLRNPLAAIVNGIGLLDRQVGDAEPSARRVLTRMRSSSRRMTSMIDQLLDLARIRLAGGVPIERAKMDLRDVVERVRAELLTVHPTRAIDVHTRGDATGNWDAERIAQALSNLISNALVHGAPGEPVRVNLDASPDAVSVSVQNRGVIDGAVRAELFDPFRRGRRAQGRGEGLGLGLFIVSEIIRAHGASIDVTSTEEDGTAFRFSLSRAA